MSPPNIPPKRLGGTDFFNIPPTLSDLGGTHFLFPATLVGEPLFADFPANLEGKSPDIPTKQGYFAGESRFLSKSPANRGCSHQTWIPQQKNGLEGSTTKILLGRCSISPPIGGDVPPKFPPHLSEIDPFCWGFFLSVPPYWGGSTTMVQPKQANLNQQPCEFGGRKGAKSSVDLTAGWFDL